MPTPTTTAATPRTTSASYDRAIADYDKAIRLNPKYAFAYNNRGLAYDRTRRPSTAPSPTIDEAIKHDPKYAAGLQQPRLRVLTKRATIDRAIADYNKAIRLDPKDRLAYNNRGRRVQRRGTTTAPLPTTTRR